MKYFLATKDQKPYATGIERTEYTLYGPRNVPAKPRQVSTIASARAYAMRELNTNPSIEYFWIKQAMKDGDKTVGCVFFDRSGSAFRSYKGLGWVYVPIEGDMAASLKHDGSIKQFTDESSIRKAKSLRSRIRKA